MSHAPIGYWQFARAEYIFAARHQYDVCNVLYPTSYSSHAPAMETDYRPPKKVRVGDRPDIRESFNRL